MTASSTRVPSAASKPKPRFSPAATPITFATGSTHTLEVAQIARTLASALHLNVDLVEALALVHDIGHPPFGHAGEKALDAIMRKQGSSSTTISTRCASSKSSNSATLAFRGLNLTFEVREGIIKHSRDYDPQSFPELAEYALDQRPPLEAQLIDLADEIAYNSADLDDGFEAHLLSLEQIREGVPVFERYFQEVDDLYPRRPIN